MELLADRFIVADDGPEASASSEPASGCRLVRGFDLASRDEVAIVITSAGGPSEQLQWSLRCGRFAHLHHAAVARLLDYGLLGETRRFEAWRAGPSWRGPVGIAEQARRVCDDFLRASDLTTTNDPCLAIWKNTPLLIPDAGAGLELEAGRGAISAMSRRGAPGLETIERPAIAAVGELLADPGVHEPRIVALWGERGAGLGVATREIARLARISGVVPIDATIDDAAIWSLIQSRTTLVIDRVGGGPGWRRWLDRAVRVARSHLLLVTAHQEVPGVHNLRLEPVEDDRLVRAVRPHAFAALHQGLLVRAAARARGAPARFAATLRLTSAATPLPRVRSQTSRAAEASPPYGVSKPADQIRRWPVPGEVLTLRRQLEGAERELQAGRHVTGARAVLGSVGALIRRGDHGSAARGLLALARARLRRGRVAEARRALDGARSSAQQAGDDELLLDVAVTSGHACIDGGMLIDGETVLRGAVAAAKGQGHPTRVVDATVALARALFWQGRFEEAGTLVRSIDRDGLSPAQIVAVAAASSRAAIGCAAAGGGQSDAAQAVAAAERAQEPGLVARAARAAAFAHLAADDHAAVIREVDVCVAAARVAREPLSALRGRLLAAEAHRRGGQSTAAVRLLDCLNRLSPTAVPGTVRARFVLLRELLAGAVPKVVADRLARSTGLRALSLFIPGAGQPPGSRPVAWAEWLEVLTCAQAAPDDAVALTAVCGRVRTQLRALAVAFVVPHGKGYQSMAADGARLDPALADRVFATGQLVRWQPPAAGAEAGLPVRYAGRTQGAILVRWPVGVSPDPTRVETCLTMGAAVAAPALAAVISQASSNQPSPDGLLGVGDAIEAVRRLVDRAAAVPFPVLVEGESGSGKELVARALHRRSPRRDRAFCALNCAAVPDELFEAELFGHARGAFTGAVAERTGVLEEAHGGTLFLDEVGELSLRAQAKLLRTLQDGEIRRVGENLPRRVDVRVVAATNRNLRHEVSAERFRLDLLYRLDVIRISLPALRDRPDDLPLLVDRFWHEAAQRVNSRAMLGAATIAVLAGYAWPGNVRELQNVMAALAVRAPRRGVVPPSALPPHIGGEPPAPAHRLDEARRRFEGQFVRAALARAGGRRTQAAEELGISRQGLTKLLARLGVTE